MTNEEISALKYLKACNIKCNGINIYKVLLNLIEKQSKVIEKLYKSLEDDIGNILNLGILVDENAREKRDVSKYIDEVQLFLNTLNYNYISKDKIKAKIEEIDNEYSNKILSNEKMSLDLVNINTQRHNAMKLVLEELLERK